MRTRGGCTDATEAQLSPPVGVLFCPNVEMRPVWWCDRLQAELVLPSEVQTKLEAIDSWMQGHGMAVVSGLMEWLEAPEGGAGPMAEAAQVAVAVLADEVEALEAAMEAHAVPEQVGAGLERVCAELWCSGMLLSADVGWCEWRGATGTHRTPCGSE